MAAVRCEVSIECSHRRLSVFVPVTLHPENVVVISSGAAGRCASFHALHMRRREQFTSPWIKTCDETGQKFLRSAATSHSCSAPSAYQGCTALVSDTVGRYCQPFRDTVGTLPASVIEMLLVRLFTVYCWPHINNSVSGIRIALQEKTFVEPHVAKSQCILFRTILIPLFR